MTHYKSSKQSNSYHFREMLKHQSEFLFIVIFTSQVHSVFCSIFYLAWLANIYNLLDKCVNVSCIIHNTGKDLIILKLPIRSKLFEYSHFSFIFGIIMFHNFFVLALLFIKFGFFVILYFKISGMSELQKYKRPTQYCLETIDKTYCDKILI